MIERCSEAVGIDVVEYEEIQKELTVSLLGNCICVHQTRDLEKRRLYYFPKSVLGLLGDSRKNTFLLSTSISPAIVREQYY